MKFYPAVPSLCVVATFLLASAADTAAQTGGDAPGVKAGTAQSGSWDHMDLSSTKLMDGFLRINRNSHFKTKASYSGPLEITTVVRTEKNNIRLRAYNGANVIFNWEVNGKQLRVNRPDGNDKAESGSLATANVRPLEPNKWYTIRWRITEDGMDVSVNGTSVFSEKRKYNLSSHRPAWIATAESLVDVKSFVVTPLTPNADVAQAQKKDSEPSKSEPLPPTSKMTDKDVAITTGMTNLVTSITVKISGSHSGSFCFSSDSKWLLMTHPDSQLLYEASTGRRVAELSLPTSSGDLHFLKTMNKHLNGKETKDKLATLDIKDAKWSFAWPGAESARSTGDPARPLVSWLATPDLKRVMVGLSENSDLATSNKSELSIIDAVSEKKWTVRPTSGVDSLAVTPDGKRYAYSYGRFASSQIYKLEYYIRPALQRLGHTRKLQVFEIDSDGIKDIATYDEQRNVWGIAISPDGQTVAIGSNRSIDLPPLRPSNDFDNWHKPLAVEIGEIVLWDIKSRKSRILKGHNHIVESVAFSPDGLTLASVGYDRTVYLWDVGSGKRLASFGGGQRLGSGHAVFSPNGMSLLVSRGGGHLLWELQLWDVSQFVVNHQKKPNEATKGEVPKKMEAGNADAQIARKEATKPPTEKEAGITPPKNFTNSVGMKFVWIAPGDFMTGSPKEEKARQANEIQHKVKLTKGFYMGAYTVTQEQWEEITGKKPSHFKGEKNLPVENVSWDDCQEFIMKLREKDKKPYRLPTEAEWEYSCRAGTTTPFHFGDTISTEQANYNGDPIYGSGKRGVNRKKTTPVGSFPANAFGLHDTHGNVWQWCQDCYGDYPQKDVVDPQGPQAGNARVLRGGCWANSPEHCRSAFRSRRDPFNRINFVGCRVCFFVESSESGPVASGAPSANLNEKPKVALSQDADKKLDEKTPDHEIIETLAIGALARSINADDPATKNDPLRGWAKTTPDEFNGYMQEMAKALGAKEFLNIKPTIVKDLKTPSGSKSISVNYGLTVYAGFFHSPKTGMYHLMLVKIGKKTYKMPGT